ncbi:MAG: glycosyltransferase family A protein [Cyanobacteria bacterium J06581_3]
MPAISVIIPTYNAEDIVLETINSVLDQTFTDFELIIIDDGSKDRTVELAEMIDDPRIKVFAYENAGVCTARNRGIQHASGEFISFLDHDDLWTADKLELQLSALQNNPDADVAYSQVVRMAEQRDYLVFKSSNTPLFDGSIYAHLLQGNFIGNGSNILARRKAIEAVGGFDPACPYCADWDYCLRLAAISSYVFVPKEQIIYRQIPGSMSSKVAIFEEQGLFMIEKLYQSASTEFQYLKRQTLSKFYRHCTELYLERCEGTAQVIKAYTKMSLAIRMCPKTLLEKSTLKIMSKLFLSLLFPANLVNFLIQLNKKRACYFCLRTDFAALHPVNDISVVSLGYKST